MKILLTGISGVGKTTTLVELEKLGSFVIDIDTTGLCKWKHKDTKEIVHYGLDGKDYAWLESHGWYCDTERLKILLSAIREDKNVFVSALTENMEEVVELFDKVFILTVDEEELRQRLTERTTNPFGRKEDEQDFIISEQSKLLQKINDPIRIETNITPSEVAKKILDNI